MNKKQKAKDLWILFIEFFKIGLFTIGGGLAMVPLIEDIAVNKKKWISADEMLDCIALSQALPGVLAINVATYIGKRKYGISGSIVATLGVVLPSFLVILLVSNLLGYIDGNKRINGVFIGIKAAIVGLVAVLTYRMGKQIIKTKFDAFITIFIFAAILFCGLNAVIGILIAAILGIICQVVRNR
ncbi:MAG: chromate transporter [Anaerovoracaceae bacterium]